MPAQDLDRTARVVDLEDLTMELVEVSHKLRHVGRAVEPRGAQRQLELPNLVAIASLGGALDATRAAELMSCSLEEVVRARLKLSEHVVDGLEGEVSARRRQCRCELGDEVGDERPGGAQCRTDGREKDRR